MNLCTMLMLDSKCLWKQPNTLLKRYQQVLHFMEKCKSFASYIGSRILKESWRGILIARGVRCSLFVVRCLLFVVCCCSLFLFVVVVRCCRNAILSPHDFSEQLKIWNFGKNKKVSSQWVMCNRKEIQKKSFFRPLDLLSHRRFY